MLIQRFYAKIDDGNSLVEFGEIVLHENTLEVPINGEFLNPIVIMGVPSYNFKAPITVKVHSVSSYSFKAQLEKYLYSEEIHTMEKMNYMVVEEGSWTLNDGTRFQAGRAFVDGNYENIHFEGMFFDEEPIVFT